MGKYLAIDKRCEKYLNDGMNQTSVREPKKWDVDQLAQMPQHERIAALRRKMFSLTSKTSVNPQRRESEEGGIADEDGHLRLAVPHYFEALLPGKRLLRTKIVELPVCGALVVDIISYMTSHGAYVAVIGWPELSYAEVVEKQGDLAKILVIPDPGSQRLKIIGALAEGVDVIVYKGVEYELAPSKMRVVNGQLRHGKAALLLVGTHASAAIAKIEAEVVDFLGIGQGVGRIQEIEIALQSRVRGILQTSMHRFGALRTNAEV